MAPELNASAHKDLVLCPKCGSPNVKCVLTLPIHDDPDFIVARRRRCLACSHRWYSAQGPEKVCHVRYNQHLVGGQSLSVVAISS